jgi:hypothetical protein
LQALVDSLSKQAGKKGLGTNGGQYSWAKTQEADPKAERDNGLPNNALYAGFVKAGTYDPNVKLNDGDGRAIKRDFSGIPVLVEDGSSNDSSEHAKAKSKSAKKAAKLETKRLAKLEGKRKAKRLAKLEKKTLKENEEAESEIKKAKKKSE